MTTTVAISPVPVYVQITELTNSGSVLDSNSNEIQTNVSERSVSIQADALIAPVQISTAGPQGPPGLTVPLITQGVVSGSLIYYDAAVASFKADASHTFVTTTDGGNF